MNKVLNIGYWVASQAQGLFKYLAANPVSWKKVQAANLKGELIDELKSAASKTEGITSVAESMVKGGKQ